jgi:peptide/nickel transport system substrate-binding protein
MAEGNPTLSIVNTVLLAGVLVTTTMATCSNDRLERQFIDLRKQIEAGNLSGGGGGGGSVSNLPDTRVAGNPSPAVAVGWGGSRANVTYVEGAVPDAPLTLGDKPHPQNDWYVSRDISPPGTLNFFTTNEGSTSVKTRYILGRLMTLNPENPTLVIPELATRWEVADDKLTYVYHLRRGVQFADGRPFTSADVKFSFDVMRDPEVDADHMRSTFEDVESLETPDPYTVVVKYKKQYWKGLYTVGYSLRVLNKGWYEEQIPKVAAELDHEEFSTEPGKPGFGKVFNDMRYPCPGTGPYYLADESDANDEYLKLVQNPFYFGIQVHPTWYNISQLRWLYISDTVSSFEAFRKQEIDVTVVDSDRWEDELSKDATINSISRYFEYDHMGLGFSFITWNCRQAPFDDPRVRTAMTHIINRQWILDEIERGKGTIAVLPAKRIYDIYSNELEAHAHDLEKAKALLAEAGWTDTDGDGILDKNGQRFEWELKVPSGRSFFVRVGGVIEDSCKKVGIRMTLRSLEWAKFIEDFYERRFDGICLYNSFADPWIDHYDSYHSSQDRPQGGNDPGWRDPRVDELLERSRKEFDPKERVKLYHEFNQLYYDAQPQTLLVHGLVSVLQNKRFENVKVWATGLRMHEYWVKPENVLHK